MPRWFHRREDTTHLPALAGSIASRTRVAVTYGGGERPHKYHRVAPLGIVNKAGVWYLVAQRARRITVYRVARIRALRMLDDTFDRPLDFDLIGFWEAWSSDFEATRPHIEVIVRAAPEAKASMPEIFGDAVLPALAASGPDDSEGWSDVTLTFENEIVATYRLAGFGGLIEVRSPRSVRSRLIATATATLERHAPSDRN
jgi:predicted DNA-binding transcriptional regulator YafY